MKRLLLFLIIILFVISGILYQQDFQIVLDRWINFSFCDKPVTYKLGYIDPKFNKSKEEVFEKVMQAGEMWNQMADRDLFVYDPEAILEIDLIFDERQETLNTLNQQKNQVDKEKEELDINVENFMQRREELERDLQELNDEIRYWNNKGGAPRNKYEELINKQENLQKEIDRINAMADRLNMATEKINQEVNTVNQQVQKFNNLLSVKPEEGIYMPANNKIEIYIYNTDKSFVHTVAHELGHALGLDHVDEKHSIMHPVSSPQSQATLSDQKLLTNFCEEQNRIDLIKNDLKNFWHILLTQMGYVIR